jgi:hypothetical protein
VIRTAERKAAEDFRKRFGDISGISVISPLSATFKNIVAQHSRQWIPKLLAGGAEPVALGDSLSDVMTNRLLINRNGTRL